ncbi:MAG: ribonuclease P protein component [Firmicutes bacterium]|nr:ribonuclease P protein component [Candidatus Caballimonas caccae]
MDYRLKKEKDFQLVFNKGKRVYSKNLTLIYLEQKELKVGFAISKKHGGSVQRNRIKRLLRESFRSFMPDLAQNFFFVFIPKVSSSYDFFVFKDEMKVLLSKIKVLDK